MRKKLDLIRLSQSHLNLLSICPPKFQQACLESMGSLPDPKQEESMKWGNRFHLLMQQRQLALPIASLLESDLELDRSITALIDAVPQILSSEEDPWRDAEHCRTFRTGKFLLTVIYDLLIAEKERATIFDWKSYRQPPRRDKLAHDWQTRLYLYVLAKTSDYAPEQIKMIYWFVKSGKPQNIIFNYSQLQHQQTEQDLAELLTNLEVWWQNYQNCEVDFPHRTNCQDNCPYRHLLAEESKDDHQEWIGSINEIEEISI